MRHLAQTPILREISLEDLPHNLQEAIAYTMGYRQRFSTPWFVVAIMVIGVVDPGLTPSLGLQVLRGGFTGYLEVFDACLRAG
ncbi:MAG: hypothetical protein F7C07_04935 [Desulfurococcales archaeon]|nr:hypothetical protein [Desulfurococcales archaeon]